MTCCTASGKQKGDNCRKRFECQKFKNFFTMVEAGTFKGKDMDKVYRDNFIYEPVSKSDKECKNFLARNL